MLTYIYTALTFVLTICSLFSNLIQVNNERVNSKQIVFINQIIIRVIIHLTQNQRITSQLKNRKHFLAASKIGYKRHHEMQKT